VSVNSDASGAGTAATTSASTTAATEIVNDSGITTSSASDESPVQPSLSYSEKNGFAMPDLTLLEYEALVPKVLNALILALAFGSAIYAVLNVDSGMTRGWTQSVSSLP
jgi:hypothetical protein